MSQALAAAVKVDGGAQASAAPAPQGFREGLKALIPTKIERKKLVPLGLMFFCILFNYTILRDTKVSERSNRLNSISLHILCFVVGLARRLRYVDLMKFT